MANTYTLIASNTLSSSASSVTFSSIPQTYTDLVIRYSARTNVANVPGTLVFTINNSSAAEYSFTRLYGDGSATASTRANGDSSITMTFGANGANSTSNTFNSNEIYIPSYTSSNYKPFSEFSVVENNATAGYQVVRANLWSNTAAITELKIACGSGVTFNSGSSFFLYGVKNS